MSEPRKPHPANPFNGLLTSVLIPSDGPPTALIDAMQALKDRIDAEAAELEG
jgi:hypothetical protein